MSSHFATHNSTVFVLQFQPQTGTDSQAESLGTKPHAVCPGGAGTQPRQEARTMSSDVLGASSTRL